jgi:hypothetical protein
LDGMGLGDGEGVMAFGFDAGVLLCTAVGTLFAAAGAHFTAAAGLLTAAEGLIATFFSALFTPPDGAVASIMDWP